MPIAELINMILGERINAALRESCLKTDKDILEKGEAVLNELPEEQRAAIQKYLDIFLDQASTDNEQAYLCGFEDAAYLFGKLGEILIRRFYE